MTTSSHLVEFTEGEYVISPSGWIPALKATTSEGSVLIVVSKALEFSFKDKTVTWLVEEFIWNPVSNKWLPTNTGRFNKMNSFSIMTVDATIEVDSVTGDYNIVNPAIPEIDFYLQNLAIAIMYPAIQNSINYKLNQ